jgi:hypothetical protein
MNKLNFEKKKFEKMQKNDEFGDFRPLLER